MHSPSFSSLAVPLSGREPGRFSHVSDVRGRKTLIEHGWAQLSIHLLVITAVSPHFICWNSPFNLLTVVLILTSPCSIYCVDALLVSQARPFPLIPQHQSLPLRVPHTENNWLCSTERVWLVRLMCCYDYSVLVLSLWYSYMYIQNCFVHCVSPPNSEFPLHRFNGVHK